MDAPDHRPGTDAVWACDACCSASVPGDSTLVESTGGRLTAAQSAVRSAGFRSLLYDGHPASADELAADAGLGRRSVQEAVEWLHAGGLARRNADGHLVGMAGLTIEPTRHRIEGPFGTRWAWCALDAVGIIAAIGKGVVRSRAAGQPVRISVQDGHLVPSDIVVFVPDGYGTTSVVDQWCPLVDFHSDRATAEAWQAGNRIAGSVVSVAEAASIAGPRWRALLDPP